MPQIGRLLTAMVTPFTTDGAVNYDAAQELAQRICADGADGIVVFGTTGESPALTDDEKIKLIEVVKQAIPGRNVVAGTGGNNTRHSVELSKRAIAAGAEALLCVDPYYNKPPQEGMYQHFRAISQVGPVIMYNIQSRTSVNMSVETTLRCAAEPGVIGVKEASGDITQMGFVRAGAPEGFLIWSGDDNFTLPLLSIGGYGVIASGMGHLAPGSMRRMIEAHLAGDNETARGIHLGLLPLMKTLMTISTNPIPTKTALNELGFPAGPFRLPLAPMSEADTRTVMAAVEAVGDLVTFKTQAAVR
ncbi:MAG: 4-hydroxy-tetrahydrodipicolinate synthase [bacterium]|nr:4-hydroxy-tetrahydrodipicolinate synthase [bacterium]